MSMSDPDFLIYFSPCLNTKCYTSMKNFKIDINLLSHNEILLGDLDMLGDASSNVHMQYLREGVLMTEAEEQKINQTSFIKVK